MSEQTGTFYAVSVGPGDPELLTLQAVRVTTIKSISLLSQLKQPNASEP